MADKVFYVTLAKSIPANSEEEALQTFVEDVVKGGNYDSECFDVEEEDEEGMIE